MKLGQISDEVSDPAELNITPLIDIVFILLIFFVVTHAFVHELGLPIERSEASTADEQPLPVVRVAVGRRGEITVEGQPTQAWSVESEVRTRLGFREHASVVVVADREAVANTLVEVIDACRRAGAKNVALGVDPGGDGA